MQLLMVRQSGCFADRDVCCHTSRWSFRSSEAEMASRGKHVTSPPTPKTESSTPAGNHGADAFVCVYV